MTRHPLLRFERERQPGDEYDVRFALPYLNELERDWEKLIQAAQQEKSQFHPDDLCEELVKIIDVLARAPQEDETRRGPIWRFFEESILPREDLADVPKFRPTHVYQSRFFCVWYVLFDEFHWVGICRLELDKSHGRQI